MSHKAAKMAVRVRKKMLARAFFVLAWHLSFKGRNVSALQNKPN